MDSSREWGGGGGGGKATYALLQIGREVQAGERVVHGSREFVPRSPGEAESLEVDHQNRGQPPQSQSLGGGLVCLARRAVPMNERK